MANRLRYIRRSKGLTQAKLAEQAKVNRTVIARFETGRTGMSTQNLMKIAHVLGCSMEDVLKGDTANGTIAQCI